MIQLFEFQKVEVRTELVNGDVWFSANDIFKVLNLTWKGTDSLKQRSIPNDWHIKKDSQTLGGVQEMTFVSEQALYMITFSAQKSEVSIKFAKWVAELLVKIRQSIDLGNSNELRRHLNVETQKGYSKQINAANFNKGGVEETIAYNVKSCQLHTNKRPSEIVAIGKGLGLKSKQCSSAKEVIRNIKPELACSMSFTDKLVSENGIDHETAAKTSKELAQPLFKRLMELGISRNELE